jgi:hypothetical protein
MNLTLKIPAKIVEEVHQTNESRDAKKKGIRQTKSRLGEFFK